MMNLATPFLKAPPPSAKELEKLVNGWGNGDVEEEDEEGERALTKKTLPDAKKRKLLTEATWRRDATLVDVAARLHKELGDGLFEDHKRLSGTGRGRAEETPAHPSAAISSSSSRCQLARGGCALLIKKVHKPGKNPARSSARPI